MGMSGEEKAAALLLSLDEEVAADVMKNLAPDDIRRVGKCMAELRDMPNEDIGAVAREFCLFAREREDEVTSARNNLVEGVASKALGNGKRGKLLKADEDKKLLTEDPSIENLRNTDIRLLIDSTKREHPQTVALLLAHLKPETTAEIMEQFPPEKQEDIAKRIATLGSVPHEFIDDMVKTLEAEIIDERGSGEQIGGAKMLAEVLNRMSQSSENRILESIEEANVELATDVRNLMFTFDDILKLDDVSMRVLLEAVDREVLACALKIIDGEMREKIFKNMSKRAAEMLKEDIEVMPPKRLSEVEKNQRTIIETAKRLKNEEKITIAVGNEDDILV